MQLKPGLQVGPAIHLAVQNHETGHAMRPQAAAEQFASRQIAAIDRIIALSPTSGWRAHLQQDRRPLRKWP